MQIASQVYGIETAANAICLFNDGTLAYITRKFDVHSKGKYKQEDFAALLGYTKDNAGANYKYDKAILAEEALSAEGIHIDVHAVTKPYMSHLGVHFFHHTHYSPPIIQPQSPPLVPASRVCRHRPNGNHGVPLRSECG